MDSAVYDPCVWLWPLGLGLRSSSRLPSLRRRWGGAWGFRYSESTFNINSCRETKGDSMTSKPEGSKITIYRFTEDGEATLVSESTRALMELEDPPVSLHEFISVSKRMGAPPSHVSIARLNYLKNNR